MPKSSIFESKEVKSASKKYSIAFWITSISAVISAIICILLTATVFLNNPNSQMVTMACGAILVIAILLLGTTAMNAANDEFVRAAELALQKHMLEEIERLRIPRS